MKGKRIVQAVMILAVLLMTAGQVFGQAAFKPKAEYTM